MLCADPIYIFPEGDAYVEKAKSYIWQYVNNDNTGSILTAADLTVIEQHIDDMALIVCPLSFL